MKKAEFLIELEDLLQRDEKCHENDVLEDYEEWDSLSKMSVMAFYDQNFDVKLSFSSFIDLNTVSDLIKLSDNKISG